MNDEGSDTRDELLGEIENLPPSAKLVFKVLEQEGTLTAERIGEETRLPPRTVRYALRLLEVNGIVTSEPSFMDARQTFYSLVSTLHEDDANSTQR